MFVIIVMFVISRRVMRQRAPSLREDRGKLSWSIIDLSSARRRESAQR
jgi:hypothetical protein